MKVTVNRHRLLVAMAPILLGFVPARRLARGGDCVRWITGLQGKELGQDARWAVLAVISRDGRRVIATGRAGEGSGFSVATNTLFTCLHADATVEVPPQQQTTTRQLFWFIDGTLDDLLDRFRQDFDSAQANKSETPEERKNGAQPLSR